MSSLQEITARRAMLVEQAARQRVELGAVYGNFQRPAAWVDKGYAVAKTIKSHPGVALGAAAMLAAVLVKRGSLGQLAGIAVKVARVAVPVARFWLARRNR